MSPSDSHRATRRQRLTSNPTGRLLRQPPTNVALPPLLPPLAGRRDPAHPSPPAVTGTAQERRGALGASAVTDRRQTGQPEVAGDVPPTMPPRSRGALQRAAAVEARATSPTPPPPPQRTPLARTGDGTPRRPAHLARAGGAAKRPAEATGAARTPPPPSTPPLSSSCPVDSKPPKGRRPRQGGDGSGGDAQGQWQRRWQRRLAQRPTPALSGRAAEALCGQAPAGIAGTRGKERSAQGGHRRKGRG